MADYQKQSEQYEEGIEVPFDQIGLEALRNMIEEFVTRQWEGAEDADCTLEQKVAHPR
jgi:uncharacterized protein YheU (UPF0270 family)